MKILIPIILTLISLSLTAISVLSKSYDLLLFFRYLSIGLITFCFLFYPIYFLVGKIKKVWEATRKQIISFMITIVMMVFSSVISLSEGLFFFSLFEIISLPGYGLTKSVEDFAFSTIDLKKIQWKEVKENRYGLRPIVSSSLLFDDQSVLALILIDKIDFWTNSSHYLLLKIDKNGKIIGETNFFHDNSELSLRKVADQQFIFFSPPAMISPIYSVNDHIDQLNLNMIDNRGIVQVIHFEDDYLIYELSILDYQKYSFDNRLITLKISSMSTETISQIEEGTQWYSYPVRKSVYLPFKKTLLMKQYSDLYYFYQGNYSKKYCVDIESNKNIVDFDFLESSNSFWFLMKEKNSDYQYGYYFYQCSLDNHQLAQIDYQFGDSFNHQHIADNAKIKMISKDELLILTENQIFKTNLTGRIDADYQIIKFNEKDEIRFFDNGQVYFPKLGKLYDFEGKLITDYLKID